VLQHLGCGQGYQGRESFDNISHATLLQLLDGFPARELIKQWLKAGYLENGAFNATEAGTPQGGVVTPATTLQN
jgi:RNA-directed DNA polymerase